MPASFPFIASHLAALRKKSPLVHNITNLVVMHTTANALLAAGASPVMAHAPEEMEEITGLASALVLNIGTLSIQWIESMRLALAVAVRRGIPIIIDPVGAGASTLRTRTALELLEKAPGAALRGNASEIMALAGASGKTKGVDSTASTDQAIEAARKLAARYACVVCVSGETDFVAGGSEREFSLTGGSALMTRVTGMGCSATALIGAVAACAPGELPFAVTSAMAFMSTAGSMAARETRGPGSFFPVFLDALYALTNDDITRYIRIEQTKK